MNYSYILQNKQTMNIIYLVHEKLKYNGTYFNSY